MIIFGISSTLPGADYEYNVWGGPLGRLGDEERGGDDDVSDPEICH